MAPTDPWQQYTYAELLDALRRDLQLDANTDLVPGSILPSLIDDNGRAVFLQLISALKLTGNVGLANATWAGGTATATMPVVNHGLGRIPILSGFWALTQTGTGMVNMMNFQPPDATQIYPYMTTVGGFTPVAGVVTPLCWWVVG